MELEKLNSIEIKPNKLSKEDISISLNITSVREIYETMLEQLQKSRREVENLIGHMLKEYGLSLYFEMEENILVIIAYKNILEESLYITKTNNQETSTINLLDLYKIAKMSTKNTGIIKLNFENALIELRQIFGKDDLSITLAINTKEQL